MHRVVMIALVLSLAGCGEDAGDGSGGASAVAGVGGAGVGAAPSGPIDGSVSHYGYAMDLSTLAARSTLTIDVKEGGDCYTVANELPVANATWNDEPALSVDSTAADVTLCGPGVSAGANLTVSADVVVPVATFLQLDVGFRQRNNGVGGTFSYMLSWLGGCDHFGLCDDDPATLSHFSFDVTHPLGTTVLCPGTVTPGAADTRCVLDGTLAPTYTAFSLVADTDWVRTKLFDVPNGAGGKLSIVAYEVPNGKTGESLDQVALTAFFTWLTDLLGPYPYGDELRFATGPTSFLGFEHAANIVLNNKVVNYNGPWTDPLNHVAMHEVVHQWAGNRTTLASTEDFVWKEATCEYLTYVFLDEQGAPGAAQTDLDFWHESSLEADYYPRPTDEPAPALQDFYGDAYGPGPLVLYVQLETMFGRKAVLDAIAQFLSKNDWRSVDDLRAELEKTTAADLETYFDTWVFGSGKPTVPIILAKTEANGDQVTVTLTQQGVTKPYGCAIEVELHGMMSSTTVLVDFGTAPTEMSAQATTTFAETVDSVTVNPRRRALVTTPNATRGRSPLWRYY